MLEHEKLYTSCTTNLSSVVAHSCQLGQWDMHSVKARIWCGRHMVSLDHSSDRMMINAVNLKRIVSEMRTEIALLVNPIVKTGLTSMAYIIITIMCTKFHLLMMMQTPSLFSYICSSFCSFCSCCTYVWHCLRPCQHKDAPHRWHNKVYS